MGGFEDLEVGPAILSSNNQNIFEARDLEREWGGGRIQSRSANIDQKRNCVDLHPLLLYGSDIENSCAKEMSCCPFAVKFGLQV